MLHSVSIQSRAWKKQTWHDDAGTGRSVFAQSSQQLLRDLALDGLEAVPLIMEAWRLMAVLG